MDDSTIINLFTNRAEQAIRETERKYGVLCHTVSMNILHNRQDAEECVNDTWLWTWNHIPPDSPPSLGQYLTNAVRRISLNRYRTLHAAKRDRRMEVTLEELENCCPAPEPQPGGESLGSLINDFLWTQGSLDRSLFILRYYHCMSVADIAARTGMKPNSAVKRIARLRERLRQYLTERGYRP